MSRSTRLSKVITKTVAFAICTFLLVCMLPFAQMTANADAMTNLYDYEKAGHYGTYIWHKYSDFIEVNEGDTIYFGPCMPGQYFHVADFGQDKNQPKQYINAAQMTTVDIFPNNQLILKWTATSATKYIRIANTTTSDRVFVITKNQRFDCDDFYSYWEQKNVDCDPYVRITEKNPVPAKELKNLFDKDLCKNGTYDYNGKFIDKDYITTELIPVKKGDLICFGQTNLMEDFQLKSFDSSKKPILGKVLADKCHVADIMKGLKNVVIMTYEIPDGTSYIAASCLNAYVPNYLLTKNQPFNQKTLNQFLGSENKYPVKENSPLKDLKVGFFGDSICSADVERNDPRLSAVRGWAGRIGVTNDMDWINYGVSGASLSNCRNQNTIINQLKNAQNRKFDMVILHGGVNDAWDAVPVGEAGSTDLSTMAGGLEQVLTFVEEHFPDAMVGYIINFKFTNAHKGAKLNDMGEYVRVIKEICDEHGVKYFDLYSNDKLTKNLKQNTSTYLYDSVHPTSAGYDMLYPIIESHMIELFIENHPAELGDINGDGKITAADYTMCKRAVLGMYELNALQKTAADIDGNGKITAKDYGILKRVVLGTYTLAE